VEANELTGRELVDQLRRDELDSIRSEVMAGRRDHILKSLGERGRAQELVRQQYTGRYPFELLQNANDASGDVGAGGHTARFVLTDRALLVADKGRGFGPAQIRAICGLGRSSKDPRKSIGYKGLGFKSVGEITDDPQIFSVDVGFRFNEERVRKEVTSLAGELGPAQHLPVYAFPFPLATSDVGSDAAEIERLLEDGFRTVFRLPLRDRESRPDIASHLASTLSPRLLLFLDSVEQLELSGTDNDFVATAVRERHEDHLEVLLEAHGETQHWMVFERLLPIPDGNLVAPLGDAWREVEQVRAAVAVPLAPSGFPCRLSAQPLHVYFPTEEASGFGLVLQADFSLELDRRRTSQTPEAQPYNNWLADQLGELVGTDVAVGLARRFPNEGAVVSALAMVGTPAGYGPRIVGKAVDCLQRSAFVPTVEGEPHVPGDARLLPATIPNAEIAHRLIAATELSHLVIPGVEGDADARRLLADHLGTPVLDRGDVLGWLVTPTSEEEIGRFYEFLVGWGESDNMRLFGKSLSDIPFVRTVSGEWRAPAQHLFFPRQREDLHFPEGLSVPIVDVPDIDGLKSLLEDAGVNPFEWRQLLADRVFPLLTDPETESEVRSEALKALELYFQSERGGDRKIRSQAAGVLLPARDGSGDRTGLKAAGRIYFSSDWLGDDSLERIYGPFGKCEFLAVQPDDDSDRRRELVAFYEWLGVARYSRTDRVVVEQSGTHMLQHLANHPHASRYPEAWHAWRSSDDFDEAADCGQRHPQSQQLQASYGLDRFPDLVATGDPSRLGLLWEQLARNWDSGFKECTTATLHCQQTLHSGDRRRTAPSLLAYMLDQAEWVPCLLEGQSVLKRPREVWRLAASTPKRVAERVPTLPPDLNQSWAMTLCTELGVIDAARLRPADLVRMLEDLARTWSDSPSDEGRDSSIPDTARWAMRTLNEAISSGNGDIAVATVPLLSRLKGEHIFHPSPYVAEDTLLAEAWEPTLPILDADRDLRRLHDALQLPKLDELTTKKPIPRGARPEKLEEVRADLDAALPFLAAIGVDAGRSLKEDIYRQLSRLEIQVCDELVVRYLLDGQIVDLPDALVFIAVRRDGNVRRNIGTAHLELDPETGKPHWLAFGPLLARYLNVPSQGDAFSLILEGSPARRKQFLRSRHIGEEALEEARIRLNQPPPDDDFADLLTPLVEDTGVHDEPVTPTTKQDHDDQSPARLGDEEVEDVDVEPEPQFPSINHDMVTIHQPSTSGEATDRSPATRAAGGGLGPTGAVNHARQDRLTSAVGLRGEEVVYEAERRRVAASGHDPNFVIWRSREHPLAPYDIESINDDGHTIYIEVKATTGEEERDPFEISRAELMWAIRHRSRYFIYRVTNAHLEAPTISIFADPITLVHDGAADLQLSGAWLALRAVGAPSD
jgi:hypothetical protein